MMMETAEDRSTSDVFDREIRFNHIGRDAFRYLIDSLMRSQMVIVFDIFLNDL